MHHDFFKRWFDLTTDEYRALTLVLALFLIGLIARVFVYRNQQPDPWPAHDNGETALPHE